MKRLFIILHLVLICMAPVFAQEAPPAPDDEAIGAAEGKDDGRTEEGDGADKEKKKNFNIDALMLYGQYNRILWKGSLTQSFDTFTYQLNSDFRRSNDFGYRNSRFYDNEIGFTGDADITDRWKLSPQVDVRNDSHGMFRNPYYSREEKDRVAVKIKNDFIPMPTRWTLTLGGVYCIHRLDSTTLADVTRIMPYHSSDFYKGTAELGWEYIMSAANKFRFTSKFHQYWYSTSADNDTDSASELVWNFNVSEYLKFGVGPVYEYNRDGGHFVSGLADVSTVNLKYVSVNAAYRYELFPFTPEQYYFEQRYVRPAYGLKPGRGHHAELNLEVDAAFTGDSNFYVDRLKFKASGLFLTNTRYYSYFSLPEQVLYPHQMAATRYQARGEAALGVRIVKSHVEFGGQYEYNHWFASDHVTYLPHHRAGGFFRLSVYRLETEFTTSYRGIMQTSPFIGIAMGPSVIGALSLQFRVMDSFSLFVRIDNIYNTRYGATYGYPEQGRTLIGGLRVVI